jgi:dihydroxyacetone kinase-like predicted kinase
MVEMFRFLGAQAIVDGGSTMNPSVGELIDAVEEAPAPHVILLPDDTDAVLAAAQAAARSDKPVTVVGTRSLLAGLAAMREYDPEMMEPAVVADAMERGAARLRGGSLARAGQSASTPLGEVRGGEWIGAVEGEPRLVAPTALDGFVRLVTMFAEPPPDAVTVILGEGADEGDVDEMRDWVDAHLPGADLQVVEGGQPVHAYLVSVL